ncbi:MAG: hypothetical protein ACYS47_21485, partial [Planctomycetota bacterium]
MIKPPRWTANVNEISPDWWWAWRGLIAAWPFWEATGNVVRDVVGGYDATFGSYGAGTTYPEWTATPEGIGVDFADTNGDAEAVVGTFQPDQIAATNRCTLITQIIWDAAGPDDMRVVDSNVKGPIGRMDFEYGDGTNRIIRFRVVYNSGSQLSAESPTHNFPTGVSTQAAGTYDG